MNRLEKLITEMCPDGVEYRKLSDCCSVFTDFTAAGSFADVAKNVSYLSDVNYALLVRTMDIKSNFTKGNLVYVDEHAYNYLWRVKLDKECLVLPNVGNCGEVYYITPNILPMSHCVLGPNAILIKDDLFNLKYLYYIIQGSEFQERLSKIISSTGQSKFNKTNLKNLEIPIPPLVIQQEIVKILDAMTDLEKELEKELENRRKQYEYYRDELLSFESLKKKNGGVLEVKRLGEVCKLLDSKRVPIAKSRRIKGKYPYYGANGIQDYVNDYLLDGIYILVGEDGSVITSNGKPVVNWVEGKIWVNNHAHILGNNGTVDLKYLYYCLTVIDVSNFVHGNIPKLTKGDLINLEIPVPSLKVQQQIVDILDVMGPNSASLQDALRQEIKARREQYEYYRDKLLSFKRKE